MSSESAPSSETNLNWEEFCLSVDAGPEFEFNQKGQLGSVTQQVPFSDRIAQRIFSGILPLFALSFAALSLSTWKTGFGILALNVPYALFLAWLLSPLIRPGSKTSLNRYSLLVLPLLVISWVAALLPQVLLFHLQGNAWHLEFVPLTLQENMESSLTPSHFLTYLILAAIIAGIQQVVQSRFWWIEVPGPTKISVVWRALLWLLPTLFVALVLVTDSIPTKAALDWSETQKALIEKRPLAHLPLDGESRYWRSLLKSAAPTFDHEDWREIDRLPFQRAEKPSEESFVEHTPDSGYELGACISYYRLLRTHSPDPMIQFQGVKLVFLQGPVDSESPNFALLLNSLAQSPVSNEKLELWTGKIEELKKLRLSREKELDLAAYKSLTIRELHPSESYGGWSAGGYLYDRRFNAMKGKDLEILGQSISISPTRFYFTWQHARLRKQWLKFRTSLLAMSLHEQTEILHSNRGMSHKSSFARNFWTSLPYGNDIASHSRGLYTAEAIVAIRAYSLRERKLPESLQGVVELPDRFRWEVKDGVGSIQARDGGYSVRVLGAEI